MVTTDIAAPAGVAPLHGEIYSQPHLGEHARQLGVEHASAEPSGPLRPLLEEFRRARTDLREAYAELERAVRANHDAVPAEEWLLDNFHVVDEQLREIAEDLPRGYLTKLPRLRDGHWAGAPRVYALAVDFIMHTDARLDRESLLDVVERYQESAPLTIGELWAVPIMLRLGLVENLRRLALQEVAARAERAEADAWAARLADRSQAHASHGVVVLAQLATSEQVLTDGFVAQFAQRLRDQDLPHGAVFAWLEDHLAESERTCEDVLRLARYRQAANQVSVGNCITSMRLITALDWGAFFEATSVVERELRCDPDQSYAAMDAESRDRYRKQVEQLAARSPASELEVARRAVECSNASSLPSEARQRHVGYHLIDQGSAEFEVGIGYQCSPVERISRIALSYPRLLYLGAILLLTAAMIAGPSALVWSMGLPVSVVVAVGLFLFLPASEVAISLVNLDVMYLVRPRVLPKLELDDGVPDACRTLVVVPTLLTSVAGASKLAADLEIGYLANQDPNLYFALLTDFPDADREQVDGDEAMLVHAAETIAHLNVRYAGNDERFFLFHRRRLWNARQGVWMGWERKRGKLEELNRLLRGATDTSFERPLPADSALQAVRYVITLDTDTQLPRDAARRLVGTIAHPLNRAVLDPATSRVTAGYAIVQPRVSATLTSSGRSTFARVFTGNAGIDPYTTAISDVYQDLFGAGSYYGKGIYDIDAFMTAQRGRVPDNWLLSHDLFEGLFARVALASDIELLDDFPSHFLTYTSRQHRWVRGDWQLLPWLLFAVSDRGLRWGADLPPMGWWKLFDNLRRSLLAPGIVALLMAGWTLLPGPPWFWTMLAVSALAFPIFGQLAPSLLRDDRWTLTTFFRGPWPDVRRTLAQVGIAIALLLDQAVSMVDAIIRTVWRLVVSRRSLLEWETAAEAERRGAQSLTVVARRMGAGVTLAFVILFLVLAVQPAAVPAALPLIVAWMLAPFLVFRISQPRVQPVQHLTNADVRRLRRTARKTWCFFETFVTVGDHWLPPDNYQEDPKGILARRTSPTNIGLYLLSIVAARDFGYVTLRELTERLDNTLTTMEGMERYRGHLINWYDTATLQPLHPLYVSTVDSGNLAGHLLALRRACDDLAQAPILGASTLEGIADAVALARERGEPIPEADRLSDALKGAREHPPATVLDWRILLDNLAAVAGSVAESRTIPVTVTPESGLRSEKVRATTRERTFWRTETQTRIRAASDELDLLAPWARILVDHPLPANGSDEASRALAMLVDLPSLADLPERCASAQRLKDAWPTELGEAVDAGCGRAEALLQRLHAAGRRAETYATDMDFALVYVPRLKLFSIGFNVGTGQIDASTYDLLASEARLSSLVAVAFGQVPQAHWFRLGRQLAPTRGGRALRSWSGTMFEYLMPLLVMRRYSGTLLDETYTAVVDRQIEYGGHQNVPWGISESAFNTLDLALNYQYRAFGVPGLGLKTGLADDLVVSPYSTMLAALVNAPAALTNLSVLDESGLDGRFGYYDAIDFTPSRVPPGRRSVIVRSYMAHHQGMSLVALDNLLHDEPMVRRFHADPRIQATTLLLQERVPGPVALVKVRASEDGHGPSPEPVDVGPIERAGRLDRPVPSTMLLSNGTYSVLVTAGGAGWSRHQDLAVTRWREDVTLDAGGTFVYVRRLAPGAEVGGPLVWSAAYQPTRIEADDYQVVFTPDAARFRRRDGAVETLTEVVVSPENNAEIRRVTLVNHGETTITLELTSYAEVVLAPQAADLAHPAFGSLFVETDFDAGTGALLCTRRRRSPNDPEVWLAHVSAVEGAVDPLTQFETARAAFVGRGRSVSAPIAVQQRLTNTVGAVLDPIVSLRRIVKLQPLERATVSFVTLVADSRAAALELADTFADPRGVARAFELAWTDARVELRHLKISAEQSHRFQDLASSLIFNNHRSRADGSILIRNVRGQEGLWPHGISGDRPILLVRVDDPSSIDLVHELLVAHEYWRLNTLSVDLVILNEDPGGYLQPLQDLLLGIVRSSPAQGQLDQPGGVFVRRTDLIPEEGRVLLLAAARVVLFTSKGRLSRQLAPGRGGGGTADQAAKWLMAPPTGHHSPPQGASVLPPFTPESLLFFNGLGGFSEGGRDYVVDLRPGEPTPAPWSNVIANAAFGFIVSESGSGFTWQGNSQTNRLTPWSNDAVSDPSGEALYLHDVDGDALWSPTPLPAGSGSAYRVRHTQGCTTFDHVAHDIATELSMFAPPEDPVQIRLLRVTNSSDRHRRLTVTMYAEWVLGATRERASAHVVSEYDVRSGALLARNHYADPQGRVAFLAASDLPLAYTADRTELLGRNGSRARPTALVSGGLSGTVGAGLDPCAALQVALDLEPGESRELVFLLGQAADVESVRSLIQIYRDPIAARAVCNAAVARWDELLGVIQVRTPEPTLDLMVNRWLLYQVLGCRYWARSGFYQSGGAYGFRDQLQDVLALVTAAPALAREHILRAATRQFREGDVQHWWHPDTGQGIRTRCSDDLLWLPYVTALYVRATGDAGILDEVVLFLESRELGPEEQDLFDTPSVSDEHASLYEHCLRALRRGMTRGPQGLPLIGDGDWNDGMNRVGHEGQGESVWVAWFLATTLRHFAPICETRGDDDTAEQLRAEIKRLVEAVEAHAWDGEWYRRAFFDDGTPLGSTQSDECRIDAIAQSWSVIAGAGDPERARTAMASAEKHLVRERDGMILLLDPPFDQGTHDPGYIKGYVPGVRENGGQYTHGVLWTVLATALLGDGDRAMELFGLLNPINHARTPESMARYQVEPYVVAADVYAAPQHVGRGGWTWYTGSASWMYRIAVESLLGLRLLGDRFAIDPAIPCHWPGFELRYRRGPTTYLIVVENPDRVGHGVQIVELDGAILAGHDVITSDDGREHHVRVVLGTPGSPEIASPTRPAE